MTQTKDKIAHINPNGTTCFKLYLSTGTIITIYYEGDIGEELLDEIEESMNSKMSFLACNYSIKQIVAHDGSGAILFHGKSGNGIASIDGNKIIGWSLKDC